MVEEAGIGFLGNGTPRLGSDSLQRLSTGFTCPERCCCLLADNLPPSSPTTNLRRRFHSTSRCILAVSSRFSRPSNQRRSLCTSTAIISPIGSTRRSSSSRKNGPSLCAVHQCLVNAWLLTASSANWRQFATDCRRLSPSLTRATVSAKGNHSSSHWDGL